MASRVDTAKVCSSLPVHAGSGSQRWAVVQSLPCHVVSRAPVTLQVPYEPTQLTVVEVNEAPAEWKGDVKAVGIFEDAFEVKGKLRVCNSPVDLIGLQRFPATVCWSAVC
jgi:hypothetical protein